MGLAKQRREGALRDMIFSSGHVEWSSCEDSDFCSDPPSSGTGEDRYAHPLRSFDFSPSGTL